MPRHSALRCVSGIRQNNAKPLISNGLRFVITCLLTAALWVLFHVARHSWATVAYSLDVPKETISEALGHEIGSRVTSIYIAFDRRKVDMANRNVINALQG